MRKKDKYGGDDRVRRWFTVRERRAVLLLLPLVALMVWLVAAMFRTRISPEAEMLADRMTAERESLAADNDSSGNATVAELFCFDPNTVTYEELRLLGIAPKTAAGIIKYRTAGKVFRIPEDFAACYGITDSTYAVLKPFIRIGDEFALKPRKALAVTDQGRRVGANVRNTSHAVSEPEGAGAGGGEETLNEGTFDPNTLDEAGFVSLGFSARQARTIINFRNALGGFRTVDQFAESYAVSPHMFARLKDRIVIDTAFVGVRSGRNGHKVDINSADSAELTSVRGIGPATAAAIVEYRQRLGGYCDVAQVAELDVVTERNWEMMKGQIFADSCAIRKIDINFAVPNAVAQHPYISAKLLRRILRNRQLKGGWSTIEDMIEDNTLTREEAERLAPYLHFSPATSL